MHWIARLARWSAAHRRRVLLMWVVFAVGALGLASTVGPRYSNSNSLPGTQSQHVADSLRRAFPAQAGDSDQIVLHAVVGAVSDAATEARVSAMLRRVSNLPHVSAVVSPFSSTGGQAISRDRRTAFATVLFDQPAASLPKSAVQRVIAAAEAARSAHLQVELGGAAIEQVQQPSLGLSTVVGIVAAIVVLLLTFGSVRAMSLPIITALFGLATTFGVIGVLSRAITMPSVATEFAAMIGLGVGIDYALFIVTRFREHRAADVPLHAAITQAMDTAGRAVVFAGATVIIALLGMLTLGVTFLTGMAVASALAVLMMVLAAVSVLPALLARFGDRIAVRPQPASAERTRWGRWALSVGRHPWPAFVTGLGIMLAIATPALSMRLGVSDAGNDPASQTTRHAYDLLARAFGSGFNGPLQVVADLPGRADPTTLNGITGGLRATGDVASVTPPRVSPAGTTAVWQLYAASSPQSNTTTRLVNRLRQRLLPALQIRTGAVLMVGGATATGIDFTHVLSSKLALFFAIVVLLGALVLLTVFRSVAIPVQAALMNLLSIGASLGATVAVFQFGWLGKLVGVSPGPIEPWLPVMVFAVVFGLSMDYEVFLVSRIHERFTTHRDPARAVIEGTSSTARVITAAATIMVLVFLSFAFGPGRQIKLFGLSLASAVFLDAFVIRSLLLPASLQLLGSRAWQLPAGLRRRLPHLTTQSPTNPGSNQPETDTRS